MNRSPRLVLFDLGNTLVDYHGPPLSDEEKDLVGLDRMARLMHARGMATSLD